MTPHLLEFDQLHFIDFYYVRDSRVYNPNPVYLMETLNTLHFLFVQVLTFELTASNTFPALSEEIM